MNKPLRRIISATLALSLSVTLAVNAYAEEIEKVHKPEAASSGAVAVMENSEKAKKPEKIKITKDNLPEVLDFERVKGQGFVSRLKSEEQDMCEIILENEDGTRGLYVFDSPVKFKNKNGETVDKSNKVKPHTKNGAPCFKSESNDIEVHLPATIQGGVSLKDEEVNVSMKPIPSVASKRALSVGKQKDEDSVVYEDVFDNFTDIVYTFTYDGVKEDIVLEKYNGKNTFDFEVITGGLSLEEEKGALLLKDENGEVKATMGEIVIFSADNKNNTFGEYKITEKQKNNSYIITVCVDVAYLTSPDTKYPVTIDPPINSVKDNCGIEDMQVFKGTDGTGKTETSAGNSGVSRVGWTDWGACRTLMRFANLDLSNKIKDPKQINTAYIELRDLMCQGDATSIMCSEFTGESWEESDVRTWNNLSAGSYDTSSLPVNVSYSIGYNNTSKHWYRWDIKAIAKKWVGNKNYQNKGVVFRLSNSTYENNSKYAYYMKTFSSMQGSEIYKPYFYIEYNYYVPVTNVSLSISSLTLDVGKTYTFSPIVTPHTATNQQFTWTSSNKNVATVSSGGKVTAKAVGTTTITAQSKDDPSAKATCKVTVKLPDGDNDGIPDSEDPDPQRKNKWFQYNREKAVEYAHRWHDGINREFYVYGADCANFVSQCLYEGSFAMTDDWHSIRGKSKTYNEIDGIDKLKMMCSDDAHKYKFYYEWDVTASWRSTPDLGKYLEDNNYAKDKIVINKATDIKDCIFKYDIKEGDIMLLDDDGNGIPNHATIITRIDCENGKIQYSAHTDPRIDYDVYKNYLAKNDDHDAIILRIKEGKLIYD